MALVPVAEDIAAAHRSAHEEVIPAPGMVRAVAVGLERAAEVGGGEERDIVLEPDLAQRLPEGVHGLTDRAQHGGLVVEHLVVMVPAAELHEKHLPFRAEFPVGRRRAGDHREVGGHGIARGDGRGERAAAQRSGEFIIGVHRIAGRVAIGFFEQPAVIRLEQTVHRDRAQGVEAVDRGRVVTGEGGRPVAGDAVGEDLLAGEKDALARKRDVHRHHVRRIQRTDDVGGAAAPPDGGALVGNAGLPLLDLVGVRIKRHRPVAVGRVVGQRGGTDE